MYDSVILPLAKKDISEAAKRYNNKQKNLGKKFTAEVRKTVKFIQKNPFASAILMKNVELLF